MDDRNMIRVSWFDDAALKIWRERASATAARDLLRSGTMLLRPSRWVLGALALIAVHLGTARQGRAADPPAQADTREWYGAPMVVTDGVSLVLLLGGLEAADHHSPQAGSRMALVGLGAYLIGGPTVHLVRGKATTGIVSAALRAALPVALGFVGAVAGGAIGSSMNCGDNEDCAIGGLGAGLALGVVTGAVAAMVVDDAVLARRETTSHPPPLTIAPTYQPATRQAGLALCATW